MKSKLIILCLAVLFLNNSCIVSKKKYNAALLENSSLNNKLNIALEENNKLDGIIKNITADFEKMKNELHLSNAVKSDEMSDLLLKVTQLSDLNSTLKSELDETKKMYRTQKATSQSVTGELEDLKQSNTILKRDTARIKYALELSKERFNQLEKELKLQKEKLSKSLSNNQSLSQEMTINKQKLSAFEQQLIKNKEVLESISKEFIELRKELLTAKSENRSLDPNKNKHIDNIARELGHY